MRFAVVDDQLGIPSELPLLAEGAEEQGRQIALSYGLAPPSVRVATLGDIDPANECPILLRKAAGVAGAAAYHDEDPLGNQFIIIGHDSVPSGNILIDPHGKGESLLGLIEHELEAIVDPTADLWNQQPFRDRRTGRVFNLICREIADPMQEIADHMTLKDGTKVDRIGWVLPPWFDARTAQSRQVDSHGALSEPLTLAPGGYQIAAMVSGEKNIFAELIEHHETPVAAWRMAMKKQVRSRSAKRLAKFNDLIKAA